MKPTFWIFGLAAALVIVLALVLNLSAVAADTGGPLAPETVVPGALPIQGRLTNASGTPLNGTYTIRFAFYEVETGGTALCSQSHDVAVSQGLFNSYLDNCYTKLKGQKVWLGIKVEDDDEMTPRQPIYPVPYAVTIRPGSVISGSYDPILTLVSEGTSGDYDALVAHAAGTGEGVEASADGGIGVYALSETNVAVEGISHNAGTIPAMFGCVSDDVSFCNTNDDKNAAGVTGVSERGDGLQGYATNTGSRGLYAESTQGSAIVAKGSAPSTISHLYPSIYVVQTTTGADYVVGASTLFGTRDWRVDRTGKGYFNGGMQASGADFAEQVAVSGPETAYEPGDVLVISADADRTVERSTEAYSRAVAGVYSARPGYLAGAPDTDGGLDGLPVAMVGIVPCKVSAENGPIQRGDLLVTSATPGHAMRADDDPPQGTVLGKAFGALAEGTGTIQVLVTLQ